MVHNLSAQLNTLAEIFAQVHFIKKYPKIKKGKAASGFLENDLTALVQNVPYELNTGPQPSKYIFCLFLDATFSSIIPGILGDFASHSQAQGMLRIVASVEGASVFSYRFVNLLISAQNKAVLTPPDIERFKQLPTQLPFLNGLMARYADKSRVWSVHAGLTHAQHAELANISRQIREKLFTISRGASEKKDLYQKAIQLTEAVHVAHKTAASPISASTQFVEDQALAFIVKHLLPDSAILKDHKQLIASAATLPKAVVEDFKNFVNAYLKLRVHLNNQHLEQDIVRQQLEAIHNAWKSLILQHNIT